MKRQQVINRDRDKETQKKCVTPVEDINGKFQGVE